MVADAYPVSPGNIASLWRPGSARRVRVLRYVAARRHLFSGSPAGERELSWVHESGQSARGTALPARLSQRVRGRAGRRPGGGPAPLPLMVRRSNELVEHPKRWANLLPSGRHSGRNIRLGSCPCSVGPIPGSTAADIRCARVERGPVLEGALVLGDPAPTPCPLTSGGRRRQAYAAGVNTLSFESLILLSPTLKR